MTFFYKNEHVILIPEAMNRQKIIKNNNNKKSDRTDMPDAPKLSVQETRKLLLVEAAYQVEIIYWVIKYSSNTIQIVVIHKNNYLSNHLFL